MKMNFTLTSNVELEKELLDHFEIVIGELASQLPPIYLGNIEIVEKIPDNENALAKVVPISGDRCDLLISEKIPKQLACPEFAQSARHVINHELCHCVDAANLSKFIDCATALKRDYDYMTVAGFYLSLGCEFWGEYFACRLSMNTYYEYIHKPLDKHADKASTYLYILNKQTAKKIKREERIKLFYICNSSIYPFIYNVVHAIGENHGSGKDIRRDEIDKLSSFRSSEYRRFGSWADDLEGFLSNAYKAYPQNFQKEHLTKCGETVFSIYKNYGLNVVANRNGSGLDFSGENVTP